MMIRYLQLTFLAAAFAVFGCGTPDPYVLFDFESDSELDRVNWECHSLFELSEKHAVHGNYALELKLFPTKYSGFTPVIGIEKWRSYSYLKFDVYNASAKQVRLNIRIDDQTPIPPYEERCYVNLMLKPGANQFGIDIHELKTTDTKRKLDLDNICKLVFFLYQPNETHVLYFDFIRLVR